MRRSIEVGAARCAGILGVGSYRPKRVVPNAELATALDSSDEWIRTRTGIKARRWAGETETLADMAAAAARTALERSGIAAADIGAVVLATISHFRQTPAAASIVADRIGAGTAAAFDLSAACSGFCKSLAVASDLVRAGSCANVLVVGVERMSDLIDKADRSTAFLFADGAGAVVVGASVTPGIGRVAWGGDGGQAEAIAQDRGWLDWQPSVDPKPAMRMDGRAVFRWATTTMAGVAQEALDAAGVKAEDLDAFIPHQANDRITDSVVKALRLPEHVVIARDIAEQGNTSAASIPLAMDALLTEGRVPPGGLALLLGFGAGLSYAGQVVRLP